MAAEGDEMRALWRKAPFWLMGACLLGLGGCPSSIQTRDFLRTEVARVIADLTRQAVSIGISSTAPQL
jgi:hypothetical protein